LEREGSSAARRVSEEIARAIVEDHADAIVLGCAGMADLADALSREHDVPVIDGVASAVKLAEALGGLGLKTGKRYGYATPIKKKYVGAMAEYSPGE
jgi:allantoin racemase